MNRIMRKVANYLWVESDEYTLIMTPELQDDIGTVGFVNYKSRRS